MDTYTAIGLAEGFIEGTPAERLEAWAYLIKTGMCWTLQGFFGRTASALIEDGVVSPEGDVLTELL